MSNPKHYELLKQGAAAWNAFREEDPHASIDLSQADLARHDLQDVNFCNVDLRASDLRHADLSGANLDLAYLVEADLRNAKLDKATMKGTDLRGATLKGASLSETIICGSDLSGTDLSRANLSQARIEDSKFYYSTMVKTNLCGARICGCKIYGISVWDVETNELTEQNDLIISYENEPTISVDNMKVAQFIHLLLNNQEVRGIINTITSKVVLILGRFSVDRKKVLDATREHLRKNNYTPVMFDFDKPTDRSFIETVSTIAHMSRFIIADFTEPKIVLQEAQHIITSIVVPFAPILKEGSGIEPITLYDLRKGRTYVMDVFCYTNAEHLLDNMNEMIIRPAEQIADRLNK